MVAVFSVLMTSNLLPQLLEEICNLGRAPEYICQKPSIQKADGTVVVASTRSNHAAEEASSEDEEEEEALHTFSQQQGEPESNRQLVHIPSRGVCVNRSPLYVTGGVVSGGMW